MRNEGSNMTDSENNFTSKEIAAANDPAGDPEDFRSYWEKVVARLTKNARNVAPEERKGRPSRVTTPPALSP
jgi:hypothetical protein